MVYLDDGKLVSKTAVPANSEKAAREYCGGNGEIIAIKDITQEYSEISLDFVIDALRLARFGKTEIELISRCLEINDIAH